MANNKLINLQIREAFIHHKKFSLSVYSVKQLFVDAVKRNLLPFIFSLVCFSMFFSQWLLMQVASDLFILIYNISDDSIHGINIIILFKPLGNKFSIVYRYFLNSTLIL